MNFQFFAGRRVPLSASAPHSSEETYKSWAAVGTPNQQKFSEPITRPARRPCGQTQAPTPNCCVERACMAFHAAHDAIMALTNGRNDEFEVIGLAELTEQRDTALQQVRAHTARTRNAYQAKVQVLIAMRKFLSVEAPDVSAFGMELAVEGAALLDKACDHNCTCQRVLGRQSRTAKRRNRFAWFARQWRHATDTPFAN
jgi:hypothetical protein